METNQNNNDSIKILLTGDFCPINRIEDLAVKKEFDALFNDFIEVLRGNDLNITDLECPLTLSDNARPKIGPHQKAHPDTVLALKYAGFNVVALANNHIMDYDHEGAAETVDLLRKYNINTIGIGRSEEEAAKPYTILIKDKKVALMNFADNEFITSTDSSWRCNAVNPLQLYSNIKEFREKYDYIVVVVHGGNEFYKLPSPRIKKLYRFIIDLGADALISHHTHAFSGFEIFKSKPIFYGLGNFLYDWPDKRNEAWNRGYVVKLSLSDRVDFEIIPLKQGNDQPGVFLLDESEQEHFRKEIEHLNRIIEDDAQLEMEFVKYCNSLYPVYDSYIEPAFGRYISWLRNRRLFPRFMSKRKR
ncbi:MAG: CapA family protein, partial [Bacteroidales bacterium]|nr:CapA family protein [Bacteroidales bacterium]